MIEIGVVCLTHKRTDAKRVAVRLVFHEGMVDDGLLCVTPETARLLSALLAGEAERAEQFARETGATFFGEELTNAVTLTERGGAT
jgi:hypothetical protein